MKFEINDLYIDPHISGEAHDSLESILQGGHAEGMHPLFILTAFYTAQIAVLSVPWRDSEAECTIPVSRAIAHHTATLSATITVAVPDHQDLRAELVAMIANRLLKALGISAHFEGPHDTTTQSEDNTDGKPATH
jgi:hypothetical protein